MIPPNCTIMAKMRFILQSALNPDLFKKVEDSLPKWPEFRLYANFRESFTNEEKKYKDEHIALLIGMENNHFEDIDQALFMLCRLEDSLKLDIAKKGIVTTGIEYRLEQANVVENNNFPSSSSCLRQSWTLEYVRDTFLK